MIPLQRLRTEAAIPAVFRGVKREERERLLLRGRRANTLEFDSAWWKPAKTQLKKETLGKCAYCEAPTATVAHGDVEHFRPKSVYWWLACCYDNYLFACQICNQTFKGNAFPTYGKAIPAPEVKPTLTDAQLEALVGRLAPDPLQDDPRCPRAKFEAAARAEKPGLIDPYLTDPEPLLAWEANATLREVALIPRKKTAANKRSVADCVEFYGLNREELRQLRWDIYEPLADVRELIELPGQPPALRTKLENILRKQMDARKPFAGMARYFIRTVWKLAL